MTAALDAVRNAAKLLCAQNARGTIRAYYPFWDAQYRPFLVDAVRRLPVEHFDYKPHPIMLTARQHVIHIAESERVWIDGIVAGREYMEMVLLHEDPEQGWVTAYDAPDNAALLALLEQAHQPTQRWFAAPESELERVITYRGDAGAERRATLHWILDHVQEHELHHRAQLSMYLRMLGIEPPPI